MRGKPSIQFYTCSNKIMKDISEFKHYEGTDASNTTSLLEYGMLWKVTDTGFEFVHEASVPGQYAITHLTAEEMTFENFSWMSEEDINSYTGGQAPQGTPTFIYDLVSYHGVENIFGSPGPGFKVFDADDLGLMYDGEGLWYVNANKTDDKDTFLAVADYSTDSAGKETYEVCTVTDGDVKSLAVVTDLEQAISFIDGYEEDVTALKAQLKDEWTFFTKMLSKLAPKK